VVLIIVTLYEIIAPLPRRFRVQAHEAGCRRNLQTLWQAIMMYQQENGGFPPWRYDVLYPKYVKDASTFICPGDRRPSKPSRRWSIPCSYMFPLSAFNSPSIQALWRRRGENCPLVLCYIHALRERQEFDDEPFWLFIRVNSKVEKVTESEKMRRRIGNTSDL
jgi:hypothetical protein